jgi:hypothetical protein
MHQVWGQWPLLCFWTTHFEEQSMHLPARANELFGVHIGYNMTKCLRMHSGQNVLWRSVRTSVYGSICIWVSSRIARKLYRCVINLTFNQITIMSRVEARSLSPTRFQASQLFGHRSTSKEAAWSFRIGNMNQQLLQREDPLAIMQSRATSWFDAQDTRLAEAKCLKALPSQDRDYMKVAQLGTYAIPGSNTTKLIGGKWRNVPDNYDGTGKLSMSRRSVCWATVGCS